MSHRHFGNLCRAYLTQAYMLSQLSKRMEIQLSKCQAPALGEKQNQASFFSVSENVPLSNDKSQSAPSMTWLGWQISHCLRMNSEECSLWRVSRTTLQSVRKITTGHEVQKFPSLRSLTLESFINFFLFLVYSNKYCSCKFVSMTWSKPTEIQAKNLLLKLCCQNLQPWRA